jgi:hypothetical protein
MNQLLAEGLVMGTNSGVKIDDGKSERIAIMANPERIKDIKKELLPKAVDQVRQ